jgi:aspartokinase
MDVADRSYAGERLPRMLGELARAEISMSLFMGGETQEEIRFACCVADSDGARLKADPNRDFSTGVKFYAGVDLVALFPHGFDLKRLGLGLAALARAGIPLRGVCSSLSAITFITDHTHSDQAAAALKGYFDPGAEAS